MAGAGVVAEKGRAAGNGVNEFVHAAGRTCQRFAKGAPGLQLARVAEHGGFPTLRPQPAEQFGVARERPDPQRLGGTGMQHDPAGGNDRPQPG